MTSKLLHLIFFVVTSLATFSSNAFADLSYDVATDFSFSSNPKGAWAYGWTSSLGGTFTLSVDKRIFDGGLQQWMGNPNSEPEVFGHPSVFFNPTSSPAGNGYFVPVNGVAFHPGLAGAHTAIRWTAQLSGSYNLQSEFTKLHFGSTSIHIFKNDSEFFTGITGDSPLTFNSQFDLSAGDTITFIAGSGLDGYFGDSTGVVARITAVPEPSSVTIVFLSLLGGLLNRCKRTVNATGTSNHSSTAIEQSAN
ncbi:MAG: PEP-CTERM sorting domain-containing protein [Pirellula sp.]|jgi:uncharacterized cupin superfamily protein|nr:PEP-CTERM sorting domain-containing protein [Pirellula sp.]